MTLILSLVSYGFYPREGAQMQLVGTENFVNTLMIKTLHDLTFWMIPPKHLSQLSAAMYDLPWASSDIVLI